MTRQERNQLVRVFDRINVIALMARGAADELREIIATADKEHAAEDQHYASLEAQGGFHGH